VAQATDAGVPYVLMVSGDYSTEKQQGILTPRLRLIRCPDGLAGAGTVTQPAIQNVSLFPDVNGRYYSACWVPEKRAVYFVPWQTTNRILKLAPVSTFTGDWVLTEELLTSGETLLLPDTGSQMKGRTFYANGCLVNFASCGMAVQAIGVQ
jgi:hypothetical protein